MHARRNGRRPVSISQRFDLVALLLLTCTGISGQNQDTVPTVSQKQTESVLFEKMPVVEAASLRQQTLQEAPGSVSVFTQEDIRRYGFRTLGEALSWATGFYESYDRVYHYVGIRGFSLPGDYNTRFLVMVNGHYMTDNVYSSNSYFGQDFALDMDLVERIEIIRGPSSVLYGSNGMFATINVVTRSPIDSAPFRVSTETGSFGEKKALASASLDLGHGANLLLSASIFNNTGQDLLIPQGDNLQLNRHAVGVDGEKGYHFFANLIWHNWSFTALSGWRGKIIPTGWYGTLFNDRGNRIDDSRSFAEAAYTADLGANKTLHWRLYYDQYRYDGRYDFDAYEGIDQPGIVDTRDRSLGDWAGSQLALRYRMGRAGDLTVGGELNWDIRTIQDNYIVMPQFLDIQHLNNPDRVFAGFAQHEWTHGRLSTNIGIRFDDSVLDGHFVSPRLSLTFQKSPKTTLKLLFGRAFRAANAFERFYTDGGVSQIPNSGLRVENISTLEASMERRFAPKWSVSGNIYYSRLGDLITAVYLPDGLLQYQNEQHDRSMGVEIEVKAHPFRDAEIAAGLALQRTTNSRAMYQPNSPSAVGQLRFYMPLSRTGLGLAGGFRCLGERRTPADGSVSPVYLSDITITSRRLLHGFDLSAGIRNLFGHRYYDPVGLENGVDRLPQDGRSFFLKLSWQSAESDMGARSPQSGHPIRGAAVGSNL